MFVSKPTELYVPHPNESKPLFMPSSVINPSVVRYATKSSIIGTKLNAKNVKAIRSNPSSLTSTSSLRMTKIPRKKNVNAKP